MANHLYEPASITDVWTIATLLCVVRRENILFYQNSNKTVRYCGSGTKYISKIDDDTLVDFDLLDRLLAHRDLSNTIACPTIMRNQKPWRHPEAKVMGKWTNLVEGILLKYFSIKLI